MQRLLIVDDEPEICELICTLIDWDALDFTLIGMVQDGVEADKIIAEQVPDIVITDIQMPGFSGLQLIARAQALPTKFIVVSGYREFEYAQTAMRFGVEDYLLKPINRKELNRILRRLEQYHKQVCEKEDEELLLRGTAQEHITNLRRTALQQVISTSRYEVDETLFSLQGGATQFAAVHIDWVQTQDSLRAHEVLLQNISMQIMQELDAMYDCEATYIDTTAYIFMHFQESEQVMAQVLRVLTRSVKEKNIQYAPARITIGLGSITHETDEWKQAAASAAQCIGARLLFSNSHVIRYAQVLALPDEPQILFTASDKKNLAADIGLLEIEKCVAFVTEWFVPIETLRCQAVCSLHQRVIEIAEFVQQTMDYLGLREDEDDAQALTPRDEALAMITRTLNNCGSVLSLRHCLCSYIRQELNACAEHLAHRESEPIRAAKQYVLAHIDKQISLDEVASQIYMSPGYFSTLFREKTDTTFSDYVIGVRMDTAKQLLRESKHSVSEVASRVGYSDARHFSKVFQKNVGIKPTAFRKFYE